MPTATLHQPAPLSSGSQPSPAAEAACAVEAPAAQEPELDFNGFLLIGCGHTAFQLLYAGIELGLFELLSRCGPMAREPLAQGLGLELQPARILLNGLVALRLLRKENASYRNSNIAERHLVPGRPGCLTQTLAWQRHIVYPGLTDFTSSLRENCNAGLRHFPGSGATLYERLSANPDLERIFQGAMSGLSSQANLQMAESADLQETRHLVDLGGGDGTNALLLARRFPGLKATVFDGPTVLESTRRKIEAAGMQDRVFTAPGDFLSGDLPEDADAFFLGHIVTIWSPDRNRMLFRKCCRALPEGGKLMVFNMVLGDDERGPLGCALGAPYFQAIATGEGMLYSGREIESWLKESGFRSVTRTPLPMDHELLVASS